MDKNSATILSNEAQKLAEYAGDLAQKLQTAAINAENCYSISPSLFAFTVFVLSCFIGYYVVWKVTPALHTPLMSVTNAISGIIVVGAMIAVGPKHFHLPQLTGFISVIIASVNIFGGFVVTYRMLEMFRKK